ncbi:MAG: hypothetical protein E7256_18250 [Lachnospiraceae bacterium]|nr:hypothetical protein [Lachnospiraceae bacterium]
MKTNKGAILCGVILSAVLLFSGCENHDEIADQVKDSVKAATKDIQTNVKEATKDIGDELKEVGADIGEGVGDIVVGTGNLIKNSVIGEGSWDGGGRYTIKGETNCDLSECEAKDLNVSVDVGDIKVSTSNKDQVSIHAAFKASAKDKEIAQEIINNADIESVIENGVLKIRVVKKGTDKDYYEYLKDHYAFFSSTCNFNSDIEVEIPKSFETFYVSADVGDITMNDLTGYVNAGTDVGDIEGEKLMLADGSSITTDVGDVQISLGAPVEKGSADIATNVGNIEIDVNGQENEVKKSSNDVVGESLTVTVAGNYEIKADTDVGNVKVE